MPTLSELTAGRTQRALQPLEAFLREYVELAGGVWDEVEPLVYDLLIEGAEPVRVTFDPEAIPEHPSAQLASLGSPLMDRLLDDARRRGAYTVLYAGGGPNTHPYDLPARLRKAYTVPAGVELVPTGVRLCYFPQATYGFVATFLSDRKEQASLEVTLDLHSGREERHLARMVTGDHLASLPAEPLPEAPHRSVPAGFAIACRQVARSLLPLANQRRRDLQEHTGRQIERVYRYYARMLEELDQQPIRAASEAEAKARKASRIDAIGRERELRASELRQKSQLSVTLALVSVAVIHLPKLLVKFDITRPGGRAATARQGVFNPWTNAFEPIQLDGDKAPTFELSI